MKGSKYPASCDFKVLAIRQLFRITGIQLNIIVKNHYMIKASKRFLSLHSILALTALLISACSSTSNPGSVASGKSDKIVLNESSFTEDFSLDSASSEIQSTYNPASRLENEVAPGYLISIESNQDTNLNGEFRISEQGILELPYDVRVSASDKSLAELRSSIRDSYRSYFRGTPDVEVAIKEKKVWVRAQGLVNKPGTYLVDPNGGLDEIVSFANGLRAGSDGISAPKFAKISSDGQQSVVRLSDFYAGNSRVVSSWRGGENVFFQSEVPSSPGKAAFDSKYIHVLGQVRAPGEYAFKDQASFFYYLVQAGGPTDRADTEKILVISSNHENGKLKTSKISLSDIEDAPDLQGGDVLFVQADNPTDLQKDAGLLGSLGGFIGSIATTILVGNEL